jgi:pentatricopeptide repeat protein
MNAPANQRHPPPDDANVYNSFAETLAANGRTSDAIAMYERVLELGSKHEGVMRAVARLREHEP